MTLVEMMVGMAIASLVLTGIGMLVIYGNRSFAAMANYVSLDQKSRHTLDLMTKEIRQTNRLIEYSDTHMAFEDFDGRPLVYLYLRSNRTLVRMKNNVLDPKPLLTSCDFLKFSIFQRNPLYGSYNQYPAASADTCKLVQMSWVCSRPLVGSLVNTESVQSAKVVLRNQ
jgi:hypothetical protein